MTTRKQINSNRKNAKKSTGPKTREGKDVSKLNALDHGILCQQTLLPNESPSDFLLFQDQMFMDLAPKGTLEIKLVETIIDRYWRLDRVRRAEPGVYGYQTAKINAQNIYKNLELGINTLNSGSYDLTNEEMIDKIIGAKDGDKSENVQEGIQYLHGLFQSFSNAEYLAEGTHATHGLAFIQSADPLNKLARYENSIERSLYRALNELRNLQKLRAEKKTLDLEPADDTSEDG